MKSYILNKIIPIVFVLCSVIAVNAQGGIVGLTSVNQGDVASYHAKPPRGTTIVSSNWSVPGGTIVTQSIQDITIQWTSSGTYTINYLGFTSTFGIMEASLVVTVAAATAPPVPDNPSITNQTCTNATLEIIAGNIPSTDQWFWQGTNSSGTSITSEATVSNNTYPVNASGTYYIRARNSSGIWSASSGSVQVTLGVIGGTTWYEDSDGDGSGDPANTITSCNQPSGYVSNGNDQCPGTYGPTGNSGCPFVNASSDENYIYTIAPQIPVSAMSELTDDNHSIRSINYFDGLGRATQSIAIQGGNDKKDIVTYMDYDGFGRQAKEYLPYASTNIDGQINTSALTDTESFYFDPKYENTSNPYSEKEFDASPLSRVFKQAAPGSDWALGAGNEIEFGYWSNTATEVKRYTVNLSFANNMYTPTLVLDTSINNGDYNANELYKTITKDENHDGTSSKAHTTEEFKDKSGRVLLKRTYGTSVVDGVTLTNVAHDTYYVYDHYGNLTYVLPPKVEADDNIPTTAELSDLCYQYKYDHRNRLIEKKIPGKGWEYIVYNLLDQPVMTQDANLKADGKWLFTKYDALGRVAYTGVKNSTGSRIYFQGLASNPSSYSQYVTRTSNANTYAGTTVYYNNVAIPTTMDEILTINYYDDYNFDLAGSGLPQNLPQVYGKTLTSNVTGLATGSKVKVLGTSEWITTVSYYDDRARPIYTYSFNDYLNTTDRIESDLDFVGKLDETTTYHTNTNDTDPTIMVKDAFTYDHMGRLKTQTQTIGTQTELIVSNTYDNLGQLVSKKVGNTDANSLQTVDYTYNIRGWLTTINQDTNNDNDLFNFTLRYNNPTSGTALYNGNISQTSWNTLNSDTSTKTYTYTYDALNRITSGIDNTTNYNLNSVAYDKNGNIASLIRKGHVVDNPVLGNSSHFNTMDDLTYDYGSTKGNQLYKVRDDQNDTYGFKDSGVDDQDYWYDANGNMTKDDNKGITNITYNHLNLPTQVTLASGNIQYIYDATGIKLRKIVSSGTTTDYAGNYVYEDSSLKFFNLPEGYVDASGANYEYVYQYKDHLGNIRLSYKNTGSTSSPSLQIQEENNYYPFGLKHKGYNGTINGTDHKYEFANKEYEEELGKNTVAYEWRDYDPAIGRFNKVDRFAEKYYSITPYHFAANNPIFFKDIKGDSIQGTARKDARRARREIRKTFRNNRKLARLFKTNGKNFKSISQKDFDRATKNSSVEEKALATGYMKAINSSEVHEVQIRKLNEKVTVGGRDFDPESFNTNKLNGSGGGNTRTSTGSLTIVLLGSSLSAPPDIVNNTTGNYITNRVRNPGRVLAHELLGHGLDRFLGGDNNFSHKINPVRVDNLFLRLQNNGSSRVYRNGGAHGPIRGIIPGTISWQVPLYLR